ncbi:MAG: hypothetical protein QM731_05590 [Chitinophagaceae bacterium]
MTIYHLPADIRISCLEVPTFPDGIPETFDLLFARLPTIEGRACYGISYMENNRIIYKAAATEMSAGESQQYGYESFIIPRGNYLTKTVNRWYENLPAVQATFELLVKEPLMDSSFPCVEMYPDNETMVCMVRSLQQ